MVGERGERERKRRAESFSHDALRLLFTAVVAALGKLPAGLDLPRRSAPSVWSFKRWIRRTTLLSGIGYVGALMKEFAANCRVCAIQGERVPVCRIGRFFHCRPLREIWDALEHPIRTQRQEDILIQLSYIGRALPKGRLPKEGIKAQREHYEVLRTPAEPLPEGRREELRTFARHWADDHLSDWVQNPEFDPTSGACLEFSRKRGGMAEFLRQRLQKAVGEVPHYLKKITTYPVVEDDVALQAHSALRKELIDEFYEHYTENNESVRASVLTIAERGLKTRIVTKSPGCVVSLAHHIRRWMASGLRTDPSIREVLAGDHREAVESLFEYRHLHLKPESHRQEQDRFILSADLKSATDLISRETYEALMEGILESKPGKTVPRWARDVFRACIGPQILHYPELGRFSISKRGALMGLPTTWPLLCLANLSWWHSGDRSQLGFVPRVRICGDDLVAKGQRRQIDAYEDAAKASGARFSSKAKHIVAKHGGVFTEEIFFVKEKAYQVEGPLPYRRKGASRPVKVALDFERWSQSFPLRGLIGTMKSDITGTEAPYWVALGPSLEIMMGHRDESARAKILRTLRYSKPEFLKFAADMGMAYLIHVPRQFGGFGIPRTTMWNQEIRTETSAERQLALAAKALALSSSWDGDLSVLSRPWQDSQFRNPIRSTAAKLAEAGLHARYEVRKVKPTTELPASDLVYPGKVQDLIEKIGGNISRDLFFTSSEPLMVEKQFHRNAAKVARTLRSRLLTARRQLVQVQGGWMLRNAKRMAFGFAASGLPDSTPEPVNRADRDPATTNKLWHAEMALESTQAYQERHRHRPPTWALLLQNLAAVEERRIAVLRTTRERNVSVPFARLEKVLERTISLSRQAGAVPIWDLPFREWPGRPSKQVFSHLFGSGEEE